MWQILFFYFTVLPTGLFIFFLFLFGIKRGTDPVLCASLYNNPILLKENRDLVEKEYRAGQVSLVRLNEAQRELTSAQTRTASALVALRQSWYSLMSETGQLTEDGPMNTMNTNESMLR